MDIYRASGLAWMAGLLLWPASVLAAPEAAGSLRELLITPGKLHRAHLHLSGNCEACHANFTRDRQDRLCLDCHDTVADDLDSNRRFHGHLEQPACGDCHTEHLGAEGAITLFDPERFMHDQADFDLAGAHGDLPCLECHNDRARARNVETGAWRIERHACSSCHEDPLEGALNEACDTCHGVDRWRKTQFDHDDTGFTLEHRHAELHCAACHADQRYEAPLSCAGCHQLRDPHRGSLGDTCDDCHVTQKWQQTAFDHDKTHFPLRAAHREIPCMVCHARAPASLARAGGAADRGEPACIECHRDADAHDGSYGEQCERCHSEQNWESAGFDHLRETGRALTGVHGRVTCTECHAPGVPVASAGARERCVDCHEADDPHRGSLGNRCADCHDDATGWQATTFDHDFTLFPLLGLHRIVGCEGCHFDAGYRSEFAACADCHQVGAAHDHAFTDQCDTCHTTGGWPAWQFDHTARTDFPLRGAHRRVACLACHTAALAMPNTPPRGCDGCHRADDAHDGHFGRDCARCHNESDFSEVIQ